MVLERPELFEGRELAGFLLFCLLLAVFSVALEYRAYRELTRFDDAVIEATVLNHYVKSKGTRRYSVLKLRTDTGAHFYTTGSASLRNLAGYRLQLQVRTGKVGFAEYLTGFFAGGRILRVYPKRLLRMTLSEKITASHAYREEGALFAALLTASPLERELRRKLATLGVSHLLAISGFHLGVLSFLLYGILTPPYTLVQSQWFPWRSRRRDLFVIVAGLLFAYLHLLGYVPSLTRAFAMTFIGYLLYDRGIRIVSMQTLAVAVALLGAFWPRLTLSLGFWLSVLGVYFILLFVQYTPRWHKAPLFVALHAWVYLMMLPTALWLFGSFSLWHPLSILWSMLFILFYPVLLLCYLVGAGHLLDGSLQWLLALGTGGGVVSLPGWAVLIQLGAALAAPVRPLFLWFAFGAAFAVFVGAVYQVA